MARPAAPAGAGCGYGGCEPQVTYRPDCSSAGAHRAAVLDTAGTGPPSHPGRFYPAALVPPLDSGRAAAQPRHRSASGAGSLGHRVCVWAPPPCREGSACGAPGKSQLGACRSRQPAHTYCRFPHASSRLRHRFGRFCFDRVSCCSTQRLRSLGLERQLVGDLERLPQREDDLVRQVLQRGHRNNAVSGPARSVCSADAAPVSPAPPLGRSRPGRNRDCAALSVVKRETQTSQRDDSAQE